VPLSKSSNKTSDIVSIRFASCHRIYPWIVTCPLNNYKLLARDSLEPIIEELKANEMILNNVIADAPMRAACRGIKCHGGFGSCDLCEAGGVGRKGTVFFPSETFTSKARHNGTFRKQISATLPNEKTGVQFKSILADIPYFNLIQGIPPEFMHLVRRCPFFEKFKKFKSVFRKKSKQFLLHNFYFLTIVFGL
jgi:hypothetical protein